ncbi:hypothetical protein [Undibacterium sp. Ji49W]|uniref:hypothetical protein n=1 Tax=Undibacterium sp. Ji49W TaxID=3413040 RepID=UPI003BF41EAD
MFYVITESDKDLLRPVSGRDPLGILPIWQYRARDLVPHLTGASRHLNGFHILLAALAWWPDFAKTYNQPVKNLTTYFILVEQAFARACTLNATPWHLPGSRRLARSSALIIGLKPEHHLLGGQLQNGVWGIYRNAAESAGLINKNSAVDSHIIEGIKDQSKVIKRLFDYLIREIKHQSTEGVQIAERSSHQVVYGLSEIIKHNPFAKLIHQPFLAPKDPAATSAIVTLMRQHASAPFLPESFLEQAKDSVPELTKVCQGIIDCERFIAAIESIFDWLCSMESTSPEDAGNKLPVNLEALHLARKKFDDSGTFPPTSLAYKRKILLDELNFSSKRTLIESVINMHENVCKLRNTKPWISIKENGKFDIIVPRYQPTENQLHPMTAWRNYYYLDSLFNLVGQFAGAGVKK